MFKQKHSVVKNEINKPKRLKVAGEGAFRTAVGAIGKRPALVLAHRQRAIRIDPQAGDLHDDAERSFRYDQEVVFVAERLSPRVVVAGVERVVDSRRLLVVHARRRNHSRLDQSACV